MAACGGDDTGEVKQDPNQTTAGSAAHGGAGSTATTSGTGGSGGSNTTGSAGHSGSGASGTAADGGKSGAASGGKAGAAGETTSNAGTTGEAGSGGSGGAAGSDEPAVDVNVSEIASSFASAICAALETCVGRAKLATLTGREDCEDRYAAGLEQDEFGSLAASIASGAVKLDKSKLDACYADTRALGCGVQTDRLPGSCQDALAAQREIGDTCTLDADCKGDAFCPIEAACPRKCEALHAEAGSCKRDAECVRGDVCNAGKCAMPAVLGAACSGTSGGVCALGTSCIGTDGDQKAGTCAANSDVQVGELDAECTPGGTLCKDGLSCAYDGSAFKCAAAVAKGDACRLALPSQCPIDTYCSAADVNQTGTCMALPTEGKACVLNNECAGGYVCLVSGNTGTCRKLGNLGDACSTSTVCRSGACSGGKCVTRARCD